MKKLEPNNSVPKEAMENDLISDNASVINKPMKLADKEDNTQVMQQANPMRESLGKTLSVVVPQKKLLQHA